MGYLLKRVFLYFVLFLTFIGTLHYYSGIENKIRDKWIICSKKSRNQHKSGKGQIQGQKESLDNLKDAKSSIKISSCSAFYKFVFKETTGTMELDKCEETHNHHLGLANSELTDKMIEDLKSFNKKSRIIDIKEHLEKKYYVQLDYQILYREFRKLYPRFGKDDANHLLNILTSKNIQHRFIIDKSNNTINRLIFSTPQMINTVCSLSHRFYIYLPYKEGLQYNVHTRLMYRG